VLYGTAIRRSHGRQWWRFIRYRKRALSDDVKASSTRAREPSGKACIQLHPIVERTEAKLNVTANRRQRFSIGNSFQYLVAL
jgi:hypothetical protein